jgi:phosphatidylserine/phosphatidylglycerophosphate/cardiolipin synthase-like enzyme
MGFFDAFRRVIVVVEIPADLDAALHATRRLAPRAELVHFAALSSSTSDPEHESAEHAAAVRALSTPTPKVEASIVAGLDVATLAALAGRVGADLVVVGPLRSCSPRERVSAFVGLSGRTRLPLVSVGSDYDPATEPPSFPRRVGLVLDVAGVATRAMSPLLVLSGGDLEFAAVATHANEARCRELEASLEALLPGRAVRVSTVSAPNVAAAQEIDRWARRAAVDLVVVAGDAVSDLEALAFGLFSGADLQRARCPTLLLPRAPSTSLLSTERLHATDTLIVEGASSRVAVERSGALGRAELEPDETLVLLPGHQSARALGHDEGVVELPSPGVAAPRLSVWLLSLASAPAERATFRALVPDRPLVLADATIDPARFDELLAGAGGAEIVFVRLRRQDAVETLRERWSSVRGGPPLLLDASAWLDDGGALDVPRAVDAQRLRRLGLRFATLGVEIAAVVTPDRWLPVAARPLDRQDDPLARELDLVTDAPVIPGNAVALDLDNAAAREALLAAIDGAERRVHLQCYIVEEDAVTAEVTRALAAASRRGVEVRLLVDALYGGHEVFGRQNPALAELTSLSLVRAFAPVVGVPDLPLLKRRNHRKCVIVDGETAIVTGRNLGAPYYQGLDEVVIRQSSSYRDVPWLDAGVTLRGPLAAAVERGFAADWARAGGQPFEVRDVAPVGPVRARYVLHEGLEDARSLDAYLALVRHAERELVVVNAFPLVVEIARALVAAVRRGVSVRVLFGSVRPRYGHDVPFVGGSIRSLADQLVRARLDALVAEGASVHEHAIAPRPGWDPSLERVFPYVHAKLMVCDRRDVAVGSANLDVTAAYWESEAMLVVHDEAFAERTLASLEDVFASSERLDRTSERWRADVATRAWLARHWPSLIG